MPAPSNGAGAPTGGGRVLTPARLAEATAHAANAKVETETQFFIANLPAAQSGLEIHDTGFPEQQSHTPVGRARARSVAAATAEPHGQVAGAGDAKDHKTREARAQ